MTTAQALDKIKKLLRMKRGGTPAEVETALGLAQKIAADYGIDFQNVNPEEPRSSAFGRKDGYSARRIPKEVEFACSIVKKYFSVLPVFQDFSAYYTIR